MFRAGSATARRMTVHMAASSPPNCKHPAGVFAPVIDPNRCEGKAACAAECPYDVFLVRRRERSELPTLSLLGAVKWWVHGGLQAEADNTQHGHRECDDSGDGRPIE